MDFADNSLLRLSTSAGRDEFLDQLALRQLAEAAFDTSLHPLEGPFALDVEKVDFGEEMTAPVTLEGHIVPAPGQLPAEVRLKAIGLQGASPARADLILRGTLIGRRILVDDRVEAVGGGFAMLDLDREIEAELGGLPADPAVLERERRTRLIERLRAGAARPDTIGDAVIDSMLASANSADMGELLDRRGTAGLARFSLKFRGGGAATPVPVRLAVTLAALVRNADSRIRDLLAESRAVQAALATMPSLQAPAAELRRRTAIPVLWLLPGAFLDDDDDWPGANRAAKRAAAADLLGGQGIVMVPG